MKLLTTKNSLFTLLGILLIAGACGGSSGDKDDSDPTDPQASTTITECTTKNICIAEDAINAGEVCFDDVNISISGSTISYDLNCPSVGCIDCNILPPESLSSDCTNENICKVLLYRGDISVVDQYCQLGQLQISAEENNEVIYNLDCNISGCLDCSDVL